MEEISIKEVIVTLLKGKFIIAGITVATLIMGAAVYLLLPKQYESTVSILANPINNIVDSDTTGQLVFPSMDILSYQQQFLNNYTLQRTITELDLRDDDGEYITYDDMREFITVENPKDTNILDVTVSRKDPDESALIANVLGANFIDYVTNVYQSSAGVSAAALADQLSIEEANLDAEAVKLRDYLMSSESIDTLNSEISTLISQITNYRAALNDLEKAIEADSLTVVQLSALAGDGASLYTNPQLSAILSDSHAYTGSYEMALSIEPSELSQTIFTMKLADIEARLIENVNNKNVMESKLDGLQNRLSDLQAKRAEEQYKYNAVQRDFSRAEAVYNTYSEQYKKALIIEAANLGNVNIKIISEAVVPVNPVNKSIVLHGGISVMLGLFIGCFAVLFWHYWNAEETLVTNTETVKAYEVEVMQD